METATYGMGCFWKPEEIFRKVKGVKETSVGYMGGNEKKFPYPTYKQVCWRNTGYVEVVQVKFNRKIIPYKKLLEVFWKNHNPTTKNRQGWDIGSQYRSIIFYHNEKQKKDARESKKEAQKLYDNKIVTEIKKAKTYYKAEDYHQRYLQK